MRVVYRMRGLLGDATEDMVERLDDGKDKDTNEEEEYKMAAILCKCGGLDAILDRLAHVKDFVQGHHLVSAALKLLGFCVRLKVNRQYLLKPSLNTVDILISILDKVNLRRKTQRGKEEHGEGERERGTGRVGGGRERGMRRGEGGGM